MGDNLALVALLVCQLALASWLMWRSPYNPLSIVGMLTTVFSFLPAVLLLGGSGFTSYSWRNFALIDVASGLDAAVFIGLLNVSLLLGAAAGQWSETTPRPLQTASGSSRVMGYAGLDERKLGAISAVFLALWAGIAFTLFRESGQSLPNFFSPVKETGVAAEQSGYLRSLYLTIPSALVIVHYWRYGRLRIAGWALVALALLATFSTHQRRELITTVLLLLSLAVFLRPPRDRVGSGRDEQSPWNSRGARRSKLTIFAALLAGLILVPVLWYARVYFTTRGEGSEVNVFEIRSFTDILLGSPTTGFPTFVLVQNYVEDYGTNALYLIAYPLTIFVPRALWAAKPVDLDTVLQNRYALMENPSSFWYGEIFYGFGLLAPVATFFLSFFLYRLCMRCQNSANLWYRTVAAVCFMQCVTLFKNGLTVYVIRTVVMLAVLGLAWMCSRSSLEAKHDNGVQELHKSRSR